MKRQFVLLAVGCQGLQQYIHCGFFQGQKACGNLTAVVCGPSSCCFVSNCTYHLYHLTVPTCKRNPLSRQAQQANGNHMNHVYWQSVEAHRSPAVRGRSSGDNDPVCTTRRALIAQTQENVCVFSVETTVPPKGLLSLTGQKAEKVMKSPSWPSEWAFQLECLSKRSETATAWLILQRSTRIIWVTHTQSQYSRGQIPDSTADR